MRVSVTKIAVPQMEFEQKYVNASIYLKPHFLGFKFARILR